MNKTWKNKPAHAAKTGIGPDLPSTPPPPQTKHVVKWAWLHIRCSIAVGIKYIDWENCIICWVYPITSNSGWWSLVKALFKIVIICDNCLLTVTGTSSGTNPNCTPLSAVNFPVRQGEQGSTSPRLAVPVIRVKAVPVRRFGADEGVEHDWTMNHETVIVGFTSRSFTWWDLVSMVCKPTLHIFIHRRKFKASRPLEKPVDPQITVGH